MAVLEVDKGKDFLWVQFLDVDYWGGPLQFVKIGGGGMKYQEGCYTRTTSLLVLECTLSRYHETQTRQVEHCSTLILFN